MMSNVIFTYKIRTDEDDLVQDLESSNTYQKSSSLFTYSMWKSSLIIYVGKHKEE